MEKLQWIVGYGTAAYRAAEGYFHPSICQIFTRYQIWRSCQPCQPSFVNFFIEYRLWIFCHPLNVKFSQDLKLGAFVISQLFIEFRLWNFCHPSNFKILQDTKYRAPFIRQLFQWISILELLSSVNCHLFHWISILELLSFVICQLFIEYRLLHFCHPSNVKFSQYINFEAPVIRQLLKISLDIHFGAPVIR